MHRDSAHQIFWSKDIAVFDFDGVLVNSNHLKADCFVWIAVANELALESEVRRYLANRPHATRFEVVRWLLTRKNQIMSESLADQLLEDFSNCSRDKIIMSGASKHLAPLRSMDSRPWSLVSGTAIQDLVHLCNEMDIASFFNAGIFGSPSSKEDNLQLCLNTAAFQPESAVYLGDRISDSEAAGATGIEFLFVESWSDENPKAKELLRMRPFVHDLGDLTVRGS